MTHETKGSLSSRVPKTGAVRDGRFGDVVIPHIHMDEPLKLECQHSSTVFALKPNPVATARIGCECRVLQAVQRSLEQGGFPVELESDRG